MTDEVKNVKCSVRDGKFVQPCDFLAEVTEYGNPRGRQKGIFAWALHSPGKGATRTFWGTKSGERVIQGMAFNFCPFCGTPISAPIEPEDDEAAG